jgi:hypothetical protein
VPTDNVLHDPTPNSHSWRRRASSASLGVLICTALFLVLVRTGADPDLWWQLRIGLDTIKNGNVAKTDSYSYVTAGNEWVNEEWLAQVIFALGWTAAGSEALILLKVLIGGLTFGLLYCHLLSLRIVPFRAAAILLFFSLGVMPYLGVVRPQIFTYLLFALLLVFIWRAEQGDYRWLWGLPILSALWVNLHGGWLAGLGVMGVWVVLHLVFNFAAWSKVLPPLFVSGLAAGATPYGFRMVTYLLSIVFVPKPGTGEWGPMLLLTTPGILWTCMVIVTTAGIAYSQRPRRIPLLAVLGVTALTPWFAIRNFPLFPIAALVLASEHIASAWERLSPIGRQQRGIHPLASVVFILLAGALLIAARAQGLQRIRPVLPIPAAPVALLKESGAEGNLANNFNWGGYILWHLGPRIKVSIDGRYDTLYTKKNLQEEGQFMLGTGDWQALIKDHQTDMALVGRIDAIYNLLSLDPAWVFVYSDDSSALFVRRESPAAGPLQRAAASFVAPNSGAYFP